MRDRTGQTWEHLEYLWLVIDTPIKRPDPHHAAFFEHAVVNIETGKRTFLWEWADEPWEMGQEFKRIA